MYHSCIFHIQKKTPRISKNLRNFGYDRLKIFYIYNSKGISLKKRDSGPDSACFWISECKKFVYVQNRSYEKKETIPQRIPALRKPGFCGIASFYTSGTSTLLLNLSSSRAKTTPTIRQTAFTRALCTEDAKLANGMIMTVAAITMPTMPWKAME